MNTRIIERISVKIDKQTDIKITLLVRKRTDEYMYDHIVETMNRGYPTIREEGLFYEFNFK